MPQFDESKVINTLHFEKAEIGKKYWYADNISSLKWEVERDFRERLGRLEDIYTEGGLFEIGPGRWYLLYPYEEPSKKRMSNRQLSGWLARGNGEYTSDTFACVHVEYSYSKARGNNEVDSNLKIHPWDSEEWIEPTVDIYERDCKGVTK